MPASYHRSASISRTRSRRLEAVALIGPTPRRRLAACAAHPRPPRTAPFGRRGRRCPDVRVGLVCRGLERRPLVPLEPIHRMLPGRAVPTRVGRPLRPANRLLVQSLVLGEPPTVKEPVPNLADRTLHLALGPRTTRAAGASGPNHQKRVRMALGKPEAPKFHLTLCRPSGVSNRTTGFALRQEAHSFWLPPTQGSEWLSRIGNGPRSPVQ